MGKFKDSIIYVWKIIRLIIYLAIGIPFWFVIIVLFLLTEGFSWLILQRSLVKEWVDLDELDNYYPEELTPVYMETYKEGKELCG